jgi:carbamoyl-phosphate synthase large subunit
MSIKKCRILTEASGSLTSGYLIKAIREAGHICVASDIDDRCFGRFLADQFILMPSVSDDDLWDKIEIELLKNHIDLVIPSLDETLLGWSERKDKFSKIGINVILSATSSIAICQDKWLTYEFFEANGIPTPVTSLNQMYPLVKPRLGRGGAGVIVTEDQVDMTGQISQELIRGVEYTVDVFCDNKAEPVYIVPRRRIGVKDGKSTAGVVENNKAILSWVKDICKKLPFVGPINMQCFLLSDGSVKFLEINPRIAGGMALGFASTENWIRLIISNLLGGEPIKPNPIQYGMEMRRYYAEIFIP